MRFRLASHEASSGRRRRRWQRVHEATEGSRELQRFHSVKGTSVKRSVFRTRNRILSCRSLIVQKLSEEKEELQPFAVQSSLERHLKFDDFARINPHGKLISVLNFGTGSDFNNGDHKAGRVFVLCCFLASRRR